MIEEDYVNGHIERRQGGKYEGRIVIDGIVMNDIEAMFFKKDNKGYLWLKRKPLLEYDEKTLSFKKRERRPQWQAYLEKSIDDSTFAYRGEFTFLRFKYSIVGIWDKVFGIEKQRLNLFVERLPMNEQKILNALTNKKSNDEERM